MIKMFWGPQLLYILHNSTMWIPLKWFKKKIDSLFCILLWKGKIPRIKLSTLQLPKDKGGLAVPNAKMYFIASQLWDGAM